MGSFIYNGQEFKEGDRVVCEIRYNMEWQEVNDARISILPMGRNDIIVYIHQNKHHGNGSSKYGYRYGWSVDLSRSSDRTYITSADTRNLRLKEVFPSYEEMLKAAFPRRNDE